MDKITTGGAETYNLELSVHRLEDGRIEAHLWFYDRSLFLGLVEPGILAEQFRGLADKLTGTLGS